jgi:hypothetical protein
MSEILSVRLSYGPGHDRSIHANADVTDDTNPRSLARRRNSPTSNPRNSLTFHEHEQRGGAAETRAKDKGIKNNEHAVC